MQAEPLQDAQAIWRDDLRTVPDMKREALEAQKTDPAGSVFLARALASVKQQSTDTLMVRLQSVDHPLVAWALQCELDAREAPPCLRPRMPEHTRQVLFVQSLADLRWLARRWPDHVTRFERMQGVFRYPIQDERWHRAALWAYRQSKGMPYMLANRLCLTDRQRCETLTMPTRRQARDRADLATRLPLIEDAVREHLTLKPDKSGRTDAAAVAAKRRMLVRVFVLLGRNQTATVDYLRCAAGVKITRQTLVRQLDAAATAGDASRLVFGRL